MIRDEAQTYLLLKYGSMGKAMASWMGSTPAELGADYFIIRDYFTSFYGATVAKTVDKSL